MQSGYAHTPCPGLYNGEFVLSRFASGVIYTHMSTGYSASLLLLLIVAGAFIVIMAIVLAFYIWLWLHRVRHAPKDAELPFAAMFISLKRDHDLRDLYEGPIQSIHALCEQVIAKVVKRHRCYAADDFGGAFLVVARSPTQLLGAAVDIQGQLAQFSWEQERDMPVVAVRPCPSGSTASPHDNAGDNTSRRPAHQRLVHRWLTGRQSIPAAAGVWVTPIPIPKLKMPTPRPRQAPEGTQSGIVVEEALSDCLSQSSSSHRPVSSGPFPVALGIGIFFGKGDITHRRDGYRSRHYQYAGPVVMVLHK